MRRPRTHLEEELLALAVADDGRLLHLDEAAREAAEELRAAGGGKWRHRSSRQEPAAGDSGVRLRARRGAAPPHLLYLEGTMYGSYCAAGRRRRVSRQDREGKGASRGAIPRVRTRLNAAGSFSNLLERGDLRLLLFELLELLPPVAERHAPRQRKPLGDEQFRQLVRLCAIVARQQAFRALPAAASPNILRDCLLRRRHAVARELAHNAVGGAVKPQELFVFFQETLHRRLGSHEESPLLVSFLEPWTPPWRQAARR